MCTLRVSRETVSRLNKALSKLGPRFRSLLGREATRTDIFRAVVDRGLTQLEDEFQLHNDDGYILEDPTLLGLGGED